MACRGSDIDLFFGQQLLAAGQEKDIITMKSSSFFTTASVVQVVSIGFSS